MNETQPPEIYYSPVDYGYKMRLPIPRPIMYDRIVGEAYPAPNLSGPIIYEYEKIGYKQLHIWQDTIEESKAGTKFKASPAYVYRLIGRV